MELLVSGATGFLGTHFVRAAGRTHRIYALARARGSADGVTWIDADLAGRVPIERLPAQVDAVVHLAQSRHDRDFPAGARDVFAVNVSATLDLLDYARVCAARRFVLVSSGGVYGTGPSPFSETDALAPPDFYLTSKHCAEALAAPYGAYFTVVILRPFFIYGPGQAGRLIPNLAARIVRGEDIQVAGGEGPRLNPVYVDDMVGALEAVLRPEAGGAYNVAGADVVSVRRLAQMIGATIGAPPRFTSPPGSVARDLVGNIERLGMLHWRPQVGLEDGLQRTFAAPPSASPRGT